MAAALLAGFVALLVGHVLPQPACIVVPAPRQPVRRQAAVQSGTIDLNQAALEDLLTRPGIGPVTARRILCERDKNGPFAYVEDLLSVKGIGPKTLEKLRPYLCLQP